MNYLVLIHTISNSFICIVLVSFLMFVIVFRADSVITVDDTSDDVYSSFVLVVNSISESFDLKFIIITKLKP